MSIHYQGKELKPVLSFQPCVYEKLLTTHDINSLSSDDVAVLQTFKIEDPHMFLGFRYVQAWWYKDSVSEIGLKMLFELGSVSQLVDYDKPDKIIEF